MKCICGAMCKNKSEYDTHFISPIHTKFMDINKYIKCHICQNHTTLGSFITCSTCKNKICNHCYGKIFNTRSVRCPFCRNREF